MKRKFLQLKQISIIITLIFFSLLIFQNCKSDHASSHIFLIPSKFQGILRIIYDEECGIKPDIENGKEILKFPENGILILNTNSYADAGNEYYLIDDGGRKTKVTEVFNSKNGLNKKPAVLASPITVSGYIYNNSEIEKKGITYKDFKLIDNNTGEVDEAALKQKLDSLANALVSACRAGLNNN